MKLATKDPQEIWANAIEYFKTARRQAVREDTVFCCYLNKTGERCVAGNALVYETAHDEKIARHYTGGITNLSDNQGIKMSKEAGELLACLQRIHDFQENWNEYGKGRFNIKGWDKMRLLGNTLGYSTAGFPE